MRLDGGNKSLGSYVVLVTQVPTSFHLSLLGSFILSLYPAPCLLSSSLGYASRSGGDGKRKRVRGEEDRSRMTDDGGLLRSLKDSSLRYFLRSSVPSVSPRPSLSLHSPHSTPFREP